MSLTHTPEGLLCDKCLAELDSRIVRTAPDQVRMMVLAMEGAWCDKCNVKLLAIPGEEIFGGDYEIKKLEG